LVTYIYIYIYLSRKKARQSEVVSTIAIVYASEKDKKSSPLPIKSKTQREKKKQCDKQTQNNATIERELAHFYVQNCININDMQEYDELTGLRIRKTKKRAKTRWTINAVKSHDTNCRKRKNQSDYA